MFDISHHVKITALASLLAVFTSSSYHSADFSKAKSESETSAPQVFKIASSPFSVKMIASGETKCLALSSSDKKEIEKTIQKSLTQKDLCFSSEKPSQEQEDIFVSVAYTPVIDRIVKKFNTNPQTTAAIVRASHQEAKKRNLDPLLVLSVIATESGFNPRAKNSSGALGLMQAIPKWHHDKISSLGISSSQLLNIRENIVLGTSILKEYLSLSRGNTQKALQRYNGSSKDRSHRYSNEVLRHYRYLANDRDGDLP